MNTRALVLLYLVALLSGGTGMLSYDQSLKNYRKAKHFGGRGRFAKNAEIWRLVAILVLLTGAILSLGIWKVYFITAPRIIGAGTAVGLGLIALVVTSYITGRHSQEYSDTPEAPKESE